MRQAIPTILLTAVLAMAGSVPLAAQNEAGAGPEMRAHTLPAGQSRMAGKVKILNVRDNVYLLEGAGANITVLTFAEGVTLVDAGLESSADDVLAAIKMITPQAITYIIDTDEEPDHVGGNAKLSSTGHHITGGNVVVCAAEHSCAEIIAHQTVLIRMTAIKPQPPLIALPETTYEQPYLKLSTIFHGGAVELLHSPAAITDGDTMVWFRNNDVIVTGDVFDDTSYPRIDLERGGSISGEIDALNQIVDLAFPEFRLEGGTLIVPGHGRICDIADVTYYRDMVTIIKDRVQEMIKKGSTLEQIKAAKVSQDYDPRYAASDYTSDMFVETIYKSLMGQTTPPVQTSAAAPVKSAPAAGEKK